MSDICVHGGCGMYLFVGQTDAGQAWLESEMDAAGYQWISGGVAVEGISYARPIAAAAMAAGLTVA